MIFYVVLPVVSRAIFDATKWQAFKTNDASSYPVANMSIKPDAGSGTAYSKFQNVSWIFFVMWPIQTLLAFLSLLTYNISVPLCDHIDLRLLVMRVA